MLDSGALALSKDDSSNTFAPDTRYGYVCDANTLKRFEGLSVDKVYQEHGMVPVPTRLVRPVAGRRAGARHAGAHLHDLRRL